MKHKKKYKRYFRILFMSFALILSCLMFKNNVFAWDWDGYYSGISLEEYNGNLMRASVELAKDWRTDRVLRKLEALLLVADAETLLMLSGSGEVIEPDGDVAAIGSGGFYALSAARALVKHTDLPAAEIAQEALSIAADICVYTNHNIKVEELD